MALANCTIFSGVDNAMSYCSEPMSQRIAAGAGFARRGLRPTALAAMGAIDRDFSFRGHRLIVLAGQRLFQSAWAAAHIP
jgi:hypothetical protein